MPPARTPHPNPPPQGGRVSAEQARGLTLPLVETEQDVTVEAPSDKAGNGGAAAAQDGSPGDEIASRMPGLPLSLRGLRVDREGFHRKKRHVPWERVTSVTASGRRVTVEGTNEKGNVKRLLHVKLGLQAARAVESLWIEACFRRVQRDGFLSGGVNAWGLRRAVWSRILIAALLILIAAWRGYVISTGDRARADAKASKQADKGGIVSGKWAVVAFAGWLGAGAAVVAVMKRRRAARLGTWWGRWRLGREGLLLRDREGNEKRLFLRATGPVVQRERGARPADLAGDAETGRAQSRKARANTAGVAVTPADLRAADELASFFELTARPVLARLFIAMAERGGARLRSQNLRRFAHGLLAAFLLFVPASVLAGVLAQGLPLARKDAISSLIASASVVLVAGMARYVYVHTRARKALPRLLEDGRAMLKRLGWQSAGPLASGPLS